MIFSPKVFRSWLDFRSLILNIENIRNMDEKSIRDMFYLFNNYGFVLLQCTNQESQDDDLLTLSRFFGSVTRHNRANSSGIVSIAVMEGYTEYLGASNEPHPLHTDSPFLRYPPKVTVLQCILPDEEGGYTKLVSCKAIYQYLNKNDPKYCEILTRSNVFNIQRDNQFIVRPIFEMYGELLSMAFRTNDSKAKVSVITEAATAMNLILSFINQDDNQLIFKLERGQVLIIDNFSILHGRTGFRRNSNRKLNRANFDGYSTYTSLLLYGFNLN